VIDENIQLIKRITQSRMNIMTAFVPCAGRGPNSRVPRAAVCSMTSKLRIASQKTSEKVNRVSMVDAVSGVSHSSSSNDEIGQKGAHNKIVFRNLKPDSFRHPVDIRATRLLKSLFGLDLVLRGMLSMVEEAFYLDNLSSGVLVSETQLPEIYKLLNDACKILDMHGEPKDLDNNEKRSAARSASRGSRSESSTLDRMLYSSFPSNLRPEIYVRQNPVPNAYTLAFQGRRPFIVIHSSLIDLMTPEELQAVIAHELGHLKCEHGVWVTMANLILLATQSIGGELLNQVSTVLSNQVLRWLRAAELTCDRAALLVAQDPEVVLSVMMKLSGGGSSIGKKLNVKAYMKQLEMFEDATKSPMGRMMGRAMTEGLTHPLPILRAKELSAYANSTEYKNLLISARRI